MSKELNRRDFVKSLAITGAGMSMAVPQILTGKSQSNKPVSVGMIGLDTSHSPAFTRLINIRDEQKPELQGFQVVAAYPYGSRKIESSYSRIPGYTEEVKEMGVEITGSIEELLDKVEVVLLLTNDGHPRLEQATQVMEAGKPMFMDKPIAGSFKDAVQIIETAKKLSAPVFTSSGRRFRNDVQAIRNENKIGNVIGADVYTSSRIEESHPDLFWYGIHGVEVLFTVLGTGCRSVKRYKTKSTDIVVGTWDNDRMGTLRGIREGRTGGGGTVFGADEIIEINTSGGYEPLIINVLEFFRTGTIPVSLEETLEIYAFMEAADESVRQNGNLVTLEHVLSKARI